LSPFPQHTRIVLKQIANLFYIRIVLKNNFLHQIRKFSKIDIPENTH